MKIYWEAGLKDFAKESHKNLTLPSFGSCSNFKRTHRFSLQVYEAIFMYHVWPLFFIVFGKELEVNIGI